MSTTEKSRNLGVDILCCLGVMFLLGLRFFDAVGLAQIPVDSYAAALPIAARWLCLSGSMLLAACIGFVLSGRKFSVSYYKIFLRLIYIYLICSGCTLAIRHFVLDETLTVSQMLQSVFNFTTSGSAPYIGMYFGLLFVAPFINAAFHSLQSRKARQAFLVMTAAVSTLQPMLQFGEISIIPEFCKYLAPIAAYIGGAYIRRYSKRKDILSLVIFLIALCLAQTVVVLSVSMTNGTITCPWLDSTATLPCLCIALSLLGIFRSRKNGSGSAHRFFGGAAGGVLAALLLGDPLMQSFMPILEDRFPILSMRLWAGLVIVPILFVIFTVLGLILQAPFLLIRRAIRGSDAEYEDEDSDDEEEETAEEIPEEEELPEESASEEEESVILEETTEESEEIAEPEEPLETAEESETAEETPEPAEESETAEETPEPIEESETAEETPEPVEESETVEEEPEPVEESETVEEEPEPAEEFHAAEDVPQEDIAEEEEAEELPVEEPQEVVSVAIPERVSQPLPTASETSSRHTITVPVSQPETQVKLTQPPMEKPIGVHEVKLPERTAKPAPKPAPKKKDYTLDDILIEQGIAVKHMPETVDELIAELTK